MIITGLEDVVKTVIIKEKDDEGNLIEIPVDKVVRVNKYKIELDDISTFRELISEKTNRPYKDICLLRTYDGWIKVAHSFKELMQFKNNLHRKINIKGLGE